MPQKFNPIGPRDSFLSDGSSLRDFFENAPVGFHALGANQIIQAMNQAELSMLGYKREEMVGCKKWPDLIAPEQRPQFEQHWKDISTGSRVANARYTLISKSGYKIEVILNASARLGPSGNLIGTRETVLDITHFRRANELSAESAASLKHEKQILEKHNKALNALLANIEIEKEDLKKSVMANTEQFILPLLRKLKRRGSSLDRRYLELLEKNLGELTSSFGGQLMNARWKLTLREIEICNMVRNGLSTKDIADTLCLSERTVEHHRNHIRQKLGVAKNNFNLKSYLQSL